MKLTNETNYDTRYLRRLFTECEKHIFETYLKHGESKRRRVRVISRRARQIGGYAWYNTLSIVMKLPTAKAKPTSISARVVAQVYLHEVGHNMNLKHKQMTNSDNIKVDWWPDEEVPLKLVKVKPKVNVVEKRAANAQKKLAEYQRKAKRIKNLLKKWQRKVKYYEKKAAASKDN